MDSTTPPTQPPPFLGFFELILFYRQYIPGKYGTEWVRVKLELIIQVPAYGLSDHV